MSTGEPSPELKRLLAASSLGSQEVRVAQASVSADQVARVLRRVAELREEQR